MASVWAQQTFISIVNFCCKLCLVPFAQDYKNGRYETAPLWHKMISYAVLALLVLTCIHKLVMTMMGITGIIPVGPAALIVSYIGYQIQMTATCALLGFVILPSLSCELLNCWIPTLAVLPSRLGRDSTSKELVTPWNDLSCSLQVLASFAGLVLLFLIQSTFSLLFPKLPITLFSSLKIGDLLEDDSDADGDHLGKILIHIICSVVDMGIYAISLVAVGLAIHFIISEVGFLKVFVHKLR